MMVAAAGFVGWRAYRFADIAYDFEAQIRYMVDNGGTIGAVPANNTFSDIFLDAIFGDNPDLLNQLRAVMRRGIERDPDISLGEVSAMIVTYSENGEGEVFDVAAHIVGGFPLGRLTPQFHRDGFFRGQLDDGLWNTGNTLLRFLGRDMVVFADEAVKAEQSEIIEGVMQGEIMPLVNRLDRPLHYTTVLPNPRGVVPPQLRHHVQAIVIKGRLEPYEGETETMILTTSPRSATYTMSVLSDMKFMAEMTLRSTFRGIEREVEWGTTINPWWSYEMAQASERATIEREENIVRIHTDFRRPMVNAALKTVERFGRDWNVKRLTHEAGMDPREVDRLIASAKPLHYWSDEHRWGPDWPIAPSPEELEHRRLMTEVRRAEGDVRQAEARVQTAEREAERAAQRLAAAGEEPAPELQAEATRTTGAVRAAQQDLETALQQVEELQRALEEAAIAAGL